MKHRKRIGVIRGGPSNEFEVSLNSGARVLSEIAKHLDEKYEAKDIFIDRNGIWHVDGLPTEPHAVLRNVDMIFNALHGTYGEDGKVQAFLESHNVPFSGSGSLSSAIGMNKVMSKKVFKDHGIKSPYFRELFAKDFASDEDMKVKVLELFQSVVLPVVVKPVNSGSSVGVSIVRDYKEFPKALREAGKHGDAVMIEEYIPGTEATCGVVEGFRGQELYALPPIEIRPITGFFDYEAKYQGKSQEIVPATFSEKTKREIEDLAKQIHKAMRLRHYSRSDFIIHPKRGIFALEVNTLPGLTDESLIPKALRAVGSNIHELIDHIIRLTIGE